MKFFLLFEAKLLNYWPLSNIKDVAGGNDIIFSYNIELVDDKFNNKNSAYNFNNGYISLPSDFYFKSDFSVTFWVNFNLIPPHDYSSIFEFGNGLETDNVGMYVIGIYVYVEINNNIDSNLQCYRFYDTSFLTNTWYHIAFVLKDNTSLLYINGELKRKETICNPSNTIRTINNIGYSTYGFISKLNGKISDFRIYDDALLDTDISAQNLKKN